MASLYHRPTDLTHALELLAQDAPRIAAGCTDLFPATERKTLPGPILDITGIAELRKIAVTPEGVRIGATCTWSDLIAAPLPAAFDGLKLAAREIGAKQIQNQGTIAGNICNASPAADGVPPLLTLDAVVEVSQADGTRHVPLADFIKGPRKIDLAPGEMVRAVIVPETASGGKGHFLKLGARAYLVISIAMTAARIEVQDGLVRHAALAVGSCGPVATRLGTIEQALIGRPLDPDLVTDADVAAAIAPIDDIRADASYRRASAAELLRQTLQDLSAAIEVTP